MKATVIKTGKTVFVEDFGPKMTPRYWDSSQGYGADELRFEEATESLPKSLWDEDNEHPVEDWKAEVANDETRLGYHEWVAHQKEEV